MNPAEAGVCGVVLFAAFVAVVEIIMRRIKKNKKFISGRIDGFCLFPGFPQLLLLREKGKLWGIPFTSLSNEFLKKLQEDKNMINKGIMIDFPKEAEVIHLLVGMVGNVREEKE